MLRIYLDKRIFWIFLNGIASGFPWVIISSGLTLWLKDLGLTRTAIGFFGLIFAVYSLNWIWAPILDRVRLPLLSRLGQRRSWLLFTQILLLIFIFLMSLTHPADNLFWFGLFALLVAICSATQDVAIDAYRIDILAVHERDKLPAGAAMSTSGWWVGYGFIGALALYLSSFGLDWKNIYMLMALVMLGFIIITLSIREPKQDTTLLRTQKKAENTYQNSLIKFGISARLSYFIAWIITTIFEPLKDFFTRFGYVAIAIFLFIMFFKVGEAFLGRMSLIFYKEIGFSTAEIATYSKLAGSTLTVVFSIFASIIAIHFSLVRSLIISGIAMASTNLIFSYMAITGANTAVFASAILLDNFTSAFSTVSFVAFISYLTNRAYTASQYALMSSVGNFGRTVFASSSGLLVDALGGDWFIFFIITALMVIPSLIMLYLVGKKLRKLLIL